MSEAIVLQTENRSDKGKGASRRLRHGDKARVPAILYGGDKAPQMLTLSHKDLFRAQQNEAFFASILTLVVDGKNEKAIIKAIQRHPAREFILHADFQRIDANKAIHVHVPLHFINEDKCVGVKAQGGIISHLASDIEVRCLPADLPEYIEVDIENVELGKIVHLSDLKLPKGVESVALSHGPEHDLAVVQVHAPKGGTEEAAPAATTTPPAAS
jgi:large subunit ribosomal protein L25